MSSMRLNFLVSRGVKSGNVLQESMIMRSQQPRAPHVAKRCCRRTAEVKCSALTQVDANASSTRPECYRKIWRAPQPSMLVKDDRVFEEEHRIRGYEVGPDRRTTMITIANLLQEVASNHAVAMWGRTEEGFATDPEMAKKGLIFVMTRMQIQMDYYPTWGEVVKFETWFQESGKMRAQRDWVVRNDAGQEIGRATSTWVMINMHTRRLSKIPESIRERYEWFQMSPPANAIHESRTRLKLPDVLSEEEADVLPQIARMSDMDMNGHINNVTYTGWVLETVPEEVQKERQLYQIEIDYKSECRSGDLVHPLAEECETPDVLVQNGAGADSLSFVHSLMKTDEQNKSSEIVRARTVWKVVE